MHWQYLQLVTTAIWETSTKVIHPVNIVSDVNWTDAADKSTGTYIKYFYENASGRDTFCGSIYWEKPNTPETGEPASTGGSGGWSQGHALDIVIDAYIRHANNPEYQAHLYETS